MSVKCRRPKLTDLGLNTDDSSVFYRTQWTNLTVVQYLFVAYRVIAALYFLGVYIYILADSSGGQIFLYLTILAYTAFVIYLIVAAVIAELDGIILRNRDTEVTGVRHKILWGIFNLSINMNLIVTIVYWSVLYQPGNTDFFVNFHVHAAPSIITTVDLFLTAVPVRFLHFIYPLAFGIAYTIMTLIFWAAGGTTPNGPIYPIIDYSNNPGLAAGVIVGLFFGIIVLHGALWALYKLRVWLWGRCCGEGAPQDEEIFIEEAL